MNGTHVPVLRVEAVKALEVTPGLTYIDATIGAGGHSLEIVKKGGIVLGIDQDREALKQAEETLGSEGTYMLVHGNFRNIEEIAVKNGFRNVAGILFDLGVSSMQLDTPKRGFSYRFTDASLDARMDTSGGDTAAQLVNRLEEKELYDIFSTFGEEQLAGVIAHALCVSRSVRPIDTVGEMVEIIAKVVPNETKRYGVLSRVFQALRIAVNDELASLKSGLNGAGAVLAPGGRLVVISFHSLEDRIVKLFMRQPGWEKANSHPIRPTARERAENIRSRSAKLRIAIKKQV